MRRLSIIIISCALSATVWSQSSTYSYVKARTMTADDASTWIDHIDYDNGLGLPYQKVDVGITPNGNSLYTLHEYDSHCRPLRTWLPGAFSGNTIQTDNDVKTASQTLNQDTKPYTWEVYEPSPLNRLTERYLPGADWHNNGKRQNVQRYTDDNGNPEGNALIIIISGSAVAFSSPSAQKRYYVENTADEDGRKTITFTDKNGKVAAVRNFRWPDYNTTYYVYDDFGDLRFVLPPEVGYYYETHSSQPLNTTGGEMQMYGYEYRYDDRHNCIYKRLPGCDPVYYIYDKAGRCILSQDGVQRLKGQWSYTIPDVFGRTVLSGTCHNTLSYTAEPLKTTVVTASQTTSGTTYGYTVSNLTLTSDTVYTVSYYDDYTFIGSNGVPLALTYTTPPSGGYGTQGLTAPRGLPTGSIIARTETSGVSGYNYSAMYYDDRGRMIQTRGTNHMGGYEYEYNGYDFTGNVVKRQHVHSVSGMSAQTEIYTYTYDHAGRLLTTKYKLNSNSEITLHQNTYDNLGRLTQKTNGSNSSMTEGYTYNVRSWLKTLSAGTLFNETLYYNDSYSGNTLQYGGNVSAMTWKADSKTRGYKFTYDDFSRLTKADYMENGSASTRYSTEYSYDRMGNFQTLKRSGLVSSGTYGQIDNLSFTYTGNQVTRVDDAVNNGPTYSGAFNFVNGASQADEYTYDKNGNMTKDLNKNISSIQYNLLNLPQNIAYGSGKSATYIYDAEGKKLRTSYKISPSATAVPTDYCGNMIYENNVLKQILVDGGYITFSGSTPQYHYYLKDHLGNNRVVCSASGTVEQVNHYYPFGGLFGESTNGDAQRFKYNDKEFDRMHGLDWYDYGARHMSPDVGRFTTIDPLAEKYYSISPYAYCANSPINAIDPDGKEKLEFLDPTDDDNKSLIEAASKFKDEENVINIWAHGSTNGITIYDKDKGENLKIDNPKDFKSFLSKNSKVWASHKEGELVKIVLHSCETGKSIKGEDCFAQKISAELNNTIVIAPNNNVYARNGIEIGTYGESIKTHGVSSNSEGRWVQFEKGSQYTTYKGSSLPGSTGYKYITSNSSWYDKLLKKIGL